MRHRAHTTTGIVVVSHAHTHTHTDTWTHIRVVHTVRVRGRHMGNRRVVSLAPVLALRIEVRVEGVTLTSGNSDHRQHVIQVHPAAIIEEW